MEIISCSIIELLQLNNHVKITAVSSQSVSLFSCISPTFGHAHFETGWCEGEDCSSTKGCWPSIHLFENVALPSFMKKKKKPLRSFLCVAVLSVKIVLWVILLWNCLVFFPSPWEMYRDAKSPPGQRRNEMNGPPCIILDSASGIAGLQQQKLHFTSLNWGNSDELRVKMASVWVKVFIFPSIESV